MYYLSIYIIYLHRTHIGWKIGATNAAAQEALKFGPFYGPLFSQNLVKNEGTLSINKPGTKLIAVEGEIAFYMKKSLPKRTDGNLHTEQDVWESVSCVSSCIEVASTRCKESLTPAIVRIY